mgnify:CR=1 FL=1|tara:strand:- start:4770 stop:5246 length:477 start_codon:yes stop_codon:yes gene_type:complete
MPTHTQGTVDAPVTKRSAGKTDTNDLKAIYSQSPMYKGEVTPESIKAQFQNEVIDAVINDQGHTFGTFDTNYVDAPNLEDVETGGGGLPASPYVPNPSSPGPGSINPTDQPEAPDGYGQNAPTQWGSGVGHALQPADSSAKISGQKLGDYVMGKSSKE